LTSEKQGEIFQSAVFLKHPTVQESTEWRHSFAQWCNGREYISRTKVISKSLISCLVDDEWAHPVLDDGAPHHNTRCFFLLSWIGPFWRRRNETLRTTCVKKRFNGYSRLSTVAAPFELNGITPGYTTRPTCKRSASGGSYSLSLKKTRHVGNVRTFF
jgi:hypothetical protein